MNLVAGGFSDDVAALLASKKFWESKRAFVFLAVLICIIVLHITGMTLEEIDQVLDRLFLLAAGMVGSYSIDSIGASLVASKRVSSNGAGNGAHTPPVAGGDTTR